MVGKPLVETVGETVGKTVEEMVAMRLIDSDAILAPLLGTLNVLV